MSNRELDERVARALGWKFNPEGDEDGYRWASNHPNPYRAHAPSRYTSDWSCCEEMLAYLRKECGCGLQIVMHDDGRCSLWPDEYSDEGTPVWPIHSGATLPEALARLVVAVAEAKEKKP